MQKLQVLIDQLTKNRKLHISIMDLTGILDLPSTQINLANAIHSRQFCTIAKSTVKGLASCLRCKAIANKKMIKEKLPFCGSCLYGLHEAAFPVIVNENVAAIVYVGNAIADKELTIARIEKTCNFTGADRQKLREELTQCEEISGCEELLQIAELVADYLKLLHSSDASGSQKLHWLVSLSKRHADEMYCTNISLKEIAVSCQKNEKYLGRLFKREMGIGFNEYCVRLRLKKARKLLLQTNAKIIDIALDCGFNNISYFNRLFKNKYGMSPRKYRKEHTSGKP